MQKRATPADKIGIEVALTSWEVALTAATAGVALFAFMLSQQSTKGARALEKLYEISTLQVQNAELEIFLIQHIRLTKRLLPWFGRQNTLQNIPRLNTII